MKVSSRNVFEPLSTVRRARTFSMSTSMPMLSLRRSPGPSFELRHCALRMVIPQSIVSSPISKSSPFSTVTIFNDHHPKTSPLSHLIDPHRRLINRSSSSSHIQTLHCEHLLPLSNLRQVRLETLPQRRLDLAPKLVGISHNLLVIVLQQLAQLRDGLGTNARRWSF